MLGKYLVCGLVVAAWFHLMACEGNIDQDGGDGDGDGDTDTDADGDDEGCSMNSGAFCTCNTPWEGQCDDGSPCIQVRNFDDPGALGFCSPSCDCSNYDQDCSSTPFGAVSRCILAGDWPIEDSTQCNCVLMNCDTEADCPPDQQCHEIVGGNGPYEGVTLWICSP